MLPSLALYVLFQFTPLREGRLNVVGDKLLHICYFNSRPSARGDSAAMSTMLKPKKFQFTPLREGRQDSVCRLRREYLISIHAPPRGATEDVEGVLQKAKHFNSRPSARGDMFFSASTIRPFNFNSRPSARGDDYIPPLVLRRDVFQFTPLREGRRLILSAIGTFSISIHAPPRGATGCVCFCTRPCVNFNSRPSARGDARTRNPHIRNFISIHAPPRGATPPQRYLIPLQAISIHAPPRGATPPQRYLIPLQAISIHAPPRGATD